MAWSCADSPRPRGRLHYSRLSPGIASDQTVCSVVTKQRPISNEHEHEHDVSLYTPGQVRLIINLLY